MSVAEGKLLSETAQEGGEAAAGLSKEVYEYVAKFIASGRVTVSREVLAEVLDYLAAVQGTLVIRDAAPPLSTAGFSLWRSFFELCL